MDDVCEGGGGDGFNKSEFGCSSFIFLPLTHRLFSNICRSCFYVVLRGFSVLTVPDDLDKILAYHCFPILYSPRCVLQLVQRFIFLIQHKEDVITHSDSVSPVPEMYSISAFLVVSDD